MAIATFKRYELKFRITKEQFDEIVPVLLEQMNSDPYCLDGNEYTIYNIYYDTPNSDVIRENSQGSRYKEKMRLRSYYALNGPDDSVFMELKKKENGIGNKRRIKMKMREVEPLLNERKAPETDGYLANQVAKEICCYLSVYHVQPAVYIQYDRFALFGKDNKDFRMTFDRNIRTRRSNFKFGPTDEDEILIGGGEYIMEVKILGAIPLWLTAILSKFELYSQGFSKYGTEWKLKTIERTLPYYLTDDDGSEQPLFAPSQNYYQTKEQ